MKLKYHYIKQHVINGDIEVLWVLSKEQIADILTKSVSSAVFNYLYPKLNMSKKDDDSDDEEEH